MSLIAELKRRNVFRVGAAYAIVGWLLVEVASVVLPTFEAPEWVMKVFTFLLILGFPVALIFAWAFELTPEGIKREADVDPAESITHTTGRKLDFAIIGLLAVAVIFMFVDNYVLESGPNNVPPPLEPVSVPVEPVLADEPTAREKSIAVLPFDNISPDPENAYFADGIHDEILAQLSKIRDLKVISRTSVMGYRGEDRPPLPKIAAALGVANILEGSVRLAGDQVRITTQLIEAESDAHLWTETYDRELTAANIFSIQSEIAKTVADALRAALSPEEQDRLDIRPTKNTDAYLAYLLGKQRFAKLNSVALAEAVDNFRHAIELDPNFALAYVALASSYIWQIDFSGLPRDQMIAKAEPLIERALELDDRSGEAHTVLGLIQAERAEFEAAEAAYQRALELNPNYPGAYDLYGNLLHTGLGRLEEALALRRKAVELNPLSTYSIVQVGWNLNGLGRFDEGLTWLKKAFEVDPGYSYTLWSLGHYHWLISGDYGEAVRWYRKAISADPGDAWSSDQLGELFMDLGDSDRAERWIHRANELSPESWIANIGMLLLHLYRGEEVTALDYGRKADEIGSVWRHVYPYQLIADHELKAGRYSEARALYEENHPELLGEDAPNVDHRNYQEAIDVALILSRTGEQERADLLLKRAFEYVQNLPRPYTPRSAIANVKLYALQGDKKKALTALRQAIDEGWRVHWWYSLRLDPGLESLHDEPEFQAMVAEIEVDMAEQLARVREMERNGELEPIPEAPVQSH
jgi:TolB-like protein/lipoprotein NlpI